MPRPVITPEQRQETRQRIRDAAAQLIRSGDSKNLTARAVAKQADVSVGTLYKYFENISDLTRSLWEEPVIELRARMRAVAEATHDPVERIRALLRAYSDFASEQHRVFRGAFLFVRPETMKKPEKTNLEKEPFSRFLTAAILEGQQAGQIIDGDAKMLAQLLWAALHGALALPVNIDRIAFDPAEEIADNMINSVMLMIRAH